MRRDPLNKENGSNDSNRKKKVHDGAGLRLVSGLSLRKHLASRTSIWDQAL
jgi:hypothetical protein